MMRIAIAGTNDFSFYIAHWIREETNHQLLILSRYSQPIWTAQGYEVMIVDYNDTTSVQHALLGVDTLISTVTGSAQIALIHAAVTNGVRRFVPANFEGPPNMQTGQDALDQGKAHALQWLQYYSSQRKIEYTTFVCGVFFERFGPGGLGEHNLGLNSRISGEGDFIINLRSMKGQAPISDATGQHVVVSLTGMNDVARFVVEALRMRQWPSEMTLYAERMTVSQLLTVAQQARGRSISSTMTYHNPATLQHELQLAQAMQDVPRQMRAHQHIATALGRYNYDGRSLNTRFPDIQPESFSAYIARAWAGIP